MEKEIDAAPSDTADQHARRGVNEWRQDEKARLLSEAAHDTDPLRSPRRARSGRKYGRRTQMGNQGDGLDGFRTSIEVLRAGADWPRSRSARLDRPLRSSLEAGPRPRRPTDRHSGCAAHVQLGPVSRPGAERPYFTTYILPPWARRGFCERAPLETWPAIRPTWVPMALKLGSPSSVDSPRILEVNPETYQQWATITFEFPAAIICRPSSSSGGKGCATEAQSATG